MIFYIIHFLYCSVCPSNKNPGCATDLHSNNQLLIRIIASRYLVDSFTLFVAIETNIRICIGSWIFCRLRQLDWVKTSGLNPQPLVWKGRMFAETISARNSYLLTLELEKCQLFCRHLLFKSIFSYSGGSISIFNKVKFRKTWENGFWTLTNDMKL